MVGKSHRKGISLTKTSPLFATCEFIYLMA